MDSNNNNNEDNDSNSDDDMPELEPTPQLNNPFTDNIIINDDAVTDLFIRMFNNPRFTGRVNYRFPPPVTIARMNEENDNEEGEEEENDNEENDNEENDEDTEERLRQQAETFISNLTNLIARPNLNTMRHRNSRLSRRRFEQLLMHSFNQKPKYKKVLSEEGEEQLKKMLYKDSSKTNESCPIYYVDFEDDSEVIELPCKHCFTPVGIEKWLKEEKNECPICRFELKSKEVKEKVYNEQQDSDDDTGEDDNENDQDEETQEGSVNMVPLLSSMRNAYNPARSRLFQPTSRESVPHSYIDSLLASEEERQMEAAILASIRDLEARESNENNEESNEESNKESNEDTDLDDGSVD